MKIKKEDGYEILHPETDENVVLVGEGRETLKSKLKSIDNKLEAQEKQINKKDIKKVCLYYGYPTAIGGAWSVDGAINIYKNYDIVVFGDEYNDPNHEQNTDLKNIIARLKKEKPSIEIFGYVPTAVQGGTKNLSTGAVKTLIGLWHTMGVTGIFYDEFGFDYYNTRERQNELVSYGKSLGMNAFVNSWEDKYLYQTQNMTIDWMPGFNPNPKNLAPVLDSNDYSLYENLFWVVDSGVQKGADAWRIHKPHSYYHDVQSEYGMTWYKKFGVKTVSLDGILSTSPEEDKKKLRTISYIGCKVMNIDGIAFGDERWGSSAYFDQWDLPNVLDLTENGKHTSSVVFNPHPVEYSTIIGSYSLKLIWDLPTSDTSDLSKGVRRVEINGSTLNDAWINIIDINNKINNLKSGFHVGTFSSNIKLKGESREFYNITGNSTLSLPDVPITQDPICLEYHVFMKFSKAYNITFPSEIKWSYLPKIEDDTLIEYVLTFICVNGSSTWIGDAIVYNDGNSVNAGTINGHDVWSGTQAEYNAIENKDSNTIYLIKDI